MRKATMVCAEFPDVRAGRIAYAMRDVGWTHDVVSRGYPPQFADAYDRIDFDPYRTVMDTTTDAEVYHVHGEMHHYFPVTDLKAVTDAPVILNVHDLACSRSDGSLDADEKCCIEAADALVWVTEEQRLFAQLAGIDIDKPYCVVPNYASARYFIDKPALPKVGGVCYEGFIAGRGVSANDRDFSPVADALGGELHIYGGNGSVDYGHDCGTVYEYPMLLQHLARHDWGFAGYHSPAESWLHSVPTKAFDYLAAGIPVISMHTPLLRPLVDLGLAIEIDDLRQLKHLPDPRKYRKQVLKHRRSFTTEAVIAPLSALYEAVCDAKL